MRLTLTTMRGDGKQKREWTFINPRDGFDFVLDRYVVLFRESGKGRFKMIGKWERIDQRNNDCEPPAGYAVLLKDQFMEALSDHVEIIE